MLRFIEIFFFSECLDPPLNINSGVVFGCYDYAQYLKNECGLINLSLTITLSQREKNKHINSKIDIKYTQISVGDAICLMVSFINFPFENVYKP